MRSWRCASDHERRAVLGVFARLKVSDCETKRRRSICARRRHHMHAQALDAVGGGKRKNAALGVGALQVRAWNAFNLYRDATRARRHVENLDRIVVANLARGQADERWIA